MQKVISNSLIEKIVEIVGLQYSIKEIDGGVVHEIFEIHSESKTPVVLKIRGSTFKANKEIIINPSDIGFEAAILSELNSHGFSQFPKLIIFAVDDFGIFMEYIGSQQVNLLTLLKNNTLESLDYRLIAEKLSELLIEINTDLTFQNEQLIGNFEKNTIKFRLNRHNISAQNYFTEKLKAMKKYYICGDMSPKNIFKFKDSIRICDLENFQLAPVEVDIYFLLAHLVLHNLQNPKLLEIINSFEFGLQKINTFIQFDEKDKIIYILLTLIYRLDNKEIKYELDNLSEKFKEEMLSKIYYMLSRVEKIENYENFVRYLQDKDNNEIEAKILEVNKEEVEMRLGSMNTKVIMDTITSIESFETPLSVPEDFEDSSLAEMVKHLKIATNNFTDPLDKIGGYLRIRQQGKEMEFTLKYKTGDSDGNFKVEKEINVSIESEDYLVKIKTWLKMSNFFAFAPQVKHRKSFLLRDNGTRVDVDSWVTPFIPTYIEIEGFDTGSIEETSKLLGFSKENLTSISGKELFKKYKVSR